MFGLHIVDFLVLITYLLGITVLGALAARMVRSMGDFFMPRRFGMTMLTMHGFGTGTHSDQAVGVASKTFTDGLSGIWYQWLWLFVSPFYWLIAPLFRRFRAITTADVYAARYGQSVAVLFAVFGILQMIAALGLALRGSGEVISSGLGGGMSIDQVILIVAVLFVIYGMASGLAGAIITDFVQGLMTIVFSVMLLVPLLPAVGGLGGIRRTILDERMFSLTAPGEIGVFYVTVIALNALVGIVAQPHLMGNCAAGRSELDGRVGFTIGNFLKRFCTVAWSLTGLAAVAYFMGRDDVHPDQIYGLVAKEFLPTILPGLLGLFLASLLASVMSSCDSFMIASSALFTKNLYRPLVPRRSERHYVWVGRIVALLVVVVSILYAREVHSVPRALEIFWMIGPMTAIAFWLGLLWRRATVAGAWASTLAAVAAWWLTTQRFFLQWAAELPRVGGLPWVRGEGEAMTIYLPWQMVFYLTAGFAAGIAVSLVTRRVPRERLERFYQVARTPVRAGEPPVTQPCSLPEGTAPAPRRVLFDGWDLEIPVPSALSIIGFVGCWGLVAALIGLFVFIARGM